MGSPASWATMQVTGNSDVRPIDETEVLRTLTVFLDPEKARGVQLRRSPCESRIRLANTNLDGAIATVKQWNPGSRGIYFSLNPIQADLNRNMLVQDALERRWFMFDCDPERPKGTNATEAEHEAARLHALAIHEDLSAYGWPAPVIVDSGNGWHLYYRVFLRNDDNAKGLLKRVFSAIARLHDTPQSKLDTGVVAANIHGKLPGTWARKGPESKDRPCRMVRLFSVPEEIIPVDEEALQALAGPEPPVKRTNYTFRMVAPGRKTEAYGRAALEREIQRVLLGERRNESLNKAAFALFQLVAGGVLEEHRVTQVLLEVAERVGLPEREARGVIASGKKGGMEHPRGVPERPDLNATPGQSSPPTPEPALKGHWQVTLDGEILFDGCPSELEEEAAEEGAKEGRHYELLTLGSLVDRDYPEPHWVIPGIMSEGLNILGGAPKQGKSMMALNIAMTLAGGGKALGDVQVNASDVLYLSLEDKHRRVKSRSLKMFKEIAADLAPSVRSRLTVATTWPRQSEGGLRLLEMWRTKVPDPTLVIIDVWARFSPPYRQSGSTYSQDSDFMAEVQRYANRHGLTALVIHHTRKTSPHKEPDDYVQEISGTLGLTGVADGILVLLRARQENQATLHITGRDVQEQELVLEFNAETLTWKSLGSQKTHIEGRVQQKVVNYLRGLGEVSAFCKDIAQGINEKEDSVRRALNRLLQDRVVRKVGNAWAYPHEPADLAMEAL